jgi:hypothetical protein
MLRKVILAGALIVLVVGPAAAQFPMPGISLGKGQKQLTPEEAAKQRALDEAYQAATKKIPAKKQADDPWGDIRSLPSSSASGR